MTPLAIAFLPLTDSAPLVAARERGFAEAEGISLRLVRDTSWAAVRDRLVYGQVQCAHLLAPLAVAVTLGLSQAQCPIAAPFKLNDNGNALTLSSELAAALDPIRATGLPIRSQPRTILLLRSGCIAASRSSASFTAFQATR